MSACREATTARFMKNCFRFGFTHRFYLCISGSMQSASLQVHVTNCSASLKKISCHRRHLQLVPLEARDITIDARKLEPKLLWKLQGMLKQHGSSRLFTGVGRDRLPAEAAFVSSCRATNERANTQYLERFGNAYVIGREHLASAGRLSQVFRKASH